LGIGLVSLIPGARDPECEMVIKARAKIEGNWVKDESREVLLGNTCLCIFPEKLM